MWIVRIFESFIENRITFLWKNIQFWHLDWAIFILKSYWQEFGINLGQKHWTLKHHVSIHRHIQYLLFMLLLPLKLLFQTANANQTHFENIQFIYVSRDEINILKRNFYYEYMQIGRFDGQFNMRNEKIELNLIFWWKIIIIMHIDQ